MIVHQWSISYRAVSKELKTKVGLPNLGTPNVILDIFTRTGVQKCQPFLTHSTPISPK